MAARSQRDRRIPSDPEHKGDPQELENPPAGDNSKTSEGGSGPGLAAARAEPERRDDVRPGGQGRVKDPTRDRRLAGNRPGPTGQGRVKDPLHDRRLAENRPGPTGQGRVKNPERDRRLAENREGPTGQGRVKDPNRDRRLAENRERARSQVSPGTERERG